MTSLAVRVKRKVKRTLLRKTIPLRSSLRAGIIGCGVISTEHIDGYENSGLSHLVAINDINPGTFSRLLDRWPFVKAYKDLHQMLSNERLDVVSVCTWPQHHAQAVAEAAAAGVRGIMCEKPLSLLLPDLETMLEACSKHNCKLAGGHQYRFHKFFRRAQDTIREGKLGRLKKVTGQIQSTLANNGPHLVDTVLFILGDPKVTSVQCKTTRNRNEWNRGFPAEDGAVSVLTLENELRCDLKTGDESQAFFSISVEGERGSLEVTPDSFVLNGQKTVDATAGDECRERQFREFVEWVKGTRPTYVADAKSSGETVRVVLALHESAKLGKPVAMPFQNRADVIAQLFPGPAPKTPSRVVATARHAVNAPERQLVSEGGKRHVTATFGTDAEVGIPEWVGLTRVILSKKMNAVGGTEVKTLEKEFAAAYGAEAAVASTSGTASIHVALGTLDPEPCDEVITTPVTDMGTVIPIMMSNCIPVFADIDPITGNLTAEAIEKKITPRTKAVILVHLFGYPAETESILEVLRPRGIALIEDCCQAHYADDRGRKIGTRGDLGCFSFQQSKQMTCGDGGMTLVNRKDLLERARMFIDKGWNRSQGRTHLFLGMNYRMTELQAAVARAQLQRLPDLISRRHKAAALLSQRLRQISPFVIPRQPSEGTRPAWWTYPFTIDQAGLGVDIDEFYQELVAEGVKVAREYVSQPVFEYPILKEYRTYGRSGYPFTAASYTPPTVSEFPGFLQFQKNLLFMVWNHTVTEKHVDMIAGAVEKVVSAFRSSGVQGVPQAAFSKAPAMAAGKMHTTANTQK